jgi:hypothetical protein
MGIRCSHCEWSCDLSDRVPATAEWCADNELSSEGIDHFLNNDLNCPECGESSAWILTGDDSSEDDYYYPE